MTGAESARADRQQHFFAECVFELGKLQFRFALVTQHFEHRRTALLGHFHTAAIDADDVHLQRLDLEVPVVAAVRASQGHF
jgi:hypothetical protein